MQIKFVSGGHLWWTDNIRWSRQRCNLIKEHTLELTALGAEHKKLCPTKTVSISLFLSWTTQTHRNTDSEVIDQNRDAVLRDSALRDAIGSGQCYVLPLRRMTYENERISEHAKSPMPSGQTQSHFGAKYQQK